MNTSPKQIKARSLALLKHLQDSDFPDAVIDDIMWDSHNFNAFGREYDVYTDDEADEVAQDSIKESLWAFNTEFIIQHSNTLRGCGERTVEAIKKMQETLCDDANPIVYALIADNERGFIKSAIRADGRGHFMNTYDGEEYEEGDYFIYRVN